MGIRGARKRHAIPVEGLTKPRRPSTIVPSFFVSGKCPIGLLAFSVRVAERSEAASRWTCKRAQARWYLEDRPIPAKVAPGLHGALILSETVGFDLEHAYRMLRKNPSSAFRAKDKCRPVSAQPGMDAAPSRHRCTILKQTVV
jgi:hypothetical protein